jgi:serine/threonine protein kinase
MCIVDIVHKQDVLHNDLNPNNVMLHFPRERDEAVFIGVCDWGMATWLGENAPSNYGRETAEELEKHRVKYYCAAPELFHVRGQRGTPQSLMRMARERQHTQTSESYSVGMLAKRIYKKDSTSTLFQGNKDPNILKVRFEQALEELTRPDPATRMSITHTVNTLKGAPYMMETPNMCYRDTAT